MSHFFCFPWDILLMLLIFCLKMQKNHISFSLYAIKRTRLANQAGENSSFIFTVCVKLVPRYHFKLACVILQMAVKEFFETHS